MSELVCLRRSSDVTPPRVRILTFNWSLEDAEPSPLAIRVHYVLRWPSPWHRGRGLDGEVRIITVESLVDLHADRWRAFTPPTLITDTLLALLEAEELCIPST